MLSKLLAALYSTCSLNNDKPGFFCNCSASRSAHTAGWSLGDIPYGMRFVNGEVHAPTAQKRSASGHPSSCSPSTTCGFWASPTGSSDPPGLSDPEPYVWEGLRLRGTSQPSTSFSSGRRLRICRARACAFHSQAARNDGCIYGERFFDKLRGCWDIWHHLSTKQARKHH